MNQGEYLGYVALRFKHPELVERLTEEQLFRLLQARLLDGFQEQTSRCWLFCTKSLTALISLETESNH